MSGPFPLDPSRFGGVISPQLLSDSVLAQLLRRGLVGPGSPAPAAPAPSTVSLEDAFARIPVAEAGHVIGPDYHNSIREFCRLLTFATGGGVDRGLIIDVPLGFLSTGAQAKPWQVELGKAVNAAGDADGWVAADLPNGAVITGLKVTGLRVGDPAGPAGTVSVALLRAKRSDPEDRVTLSRVSLGGLPPGPMDPPAAPVRPAVPQITPDQIPAFATVDVTIYRYLLQATVTAGAGAGTTQLFSVQVICDRF